MCKSRKKVADGEKVEKDCVEGKKVLLSTT